MKLASDFFASKTFWLTVAAVLTAVTSAATGQITWEAAGAAIFAALYALFNRDTTAKAGEDMKKATAEVAVRIEEHEQNASRRAQMAASHDRLPPIR